MRDYKHLTTFPGEDKPVLDAATKLTGLSINQIILRSVHERLPAIVAEHGKLDLSPLPDAVVAAGYRKLSGEDVVADRELGRASLKAQRGKA